MDKVIEATIKLKEEMNKLPLFIEYQKAKEDYENNEEIKELKKLIVRAKNESRLDDHKKLLEEFHSHPLYINYLNLSEEVNAYLKEISSYLK